MSISHSFLTCMKKTPIFLLQFVLICEGVLCKKKNPLHELLFIINAST